MMSNFKPIYISALIISSLLTGCNTTGIKRSEPEASTFKNSAYSAIQVYPQRADLPKNSKILGKVTAQNKYPNGVKATPEEIIETLKKEAVLKGGNGIVHVTPGTSQTTANAVISYY